MQKITETINLFLENHELKDEFDMTTSELNEAYLKLKDIIDDKDELWKLLCSLFRYGFSKGYQQKEYESIEEQEVINLSNIGKRRIDTVRILEAINNQDAMDYLYLIAKGVYGDLMRDGENG